ncbi:uncharacterized protein N7496_006486 [Penicillium cataractarum]|uniref:Uncharacterized protein n=1 Tax=Penicillium cataractarum TaxID=2100454 RepID=A0A9W9S3K0_9EURO|nr:uncharacterized protein N7496_006486 [Penicillium cataractarum]KAJ5370394.1 hypothetical protein N7496_006486 [Penicillium cataractarum]
MASSNSALSEPTPPDSNDLRILTAILQAVASAQPKAYAQKFALLIYWDNDKSHIKDDVSIMERLFKSLGMKTTLLVLEPAGYTADMAVVIEIYRLLSKYCVETEDSLFVLYYNGDSSSSRDDIRFSQDSNSFSH